jgi:hypothetical protein
MSPTNIFAQYPPRAVNLRTVDFCFLDRSRDLRCFFQFARLRGGQIQVRALQHRAGPDLWEHASGTGLDRVIPVPIVVVLFLAAARVIGSFQDRPRPAKRARVHCHRASILVGIPLSTFQNVVTANEL